MRWKWLSETRSRGGGGSAAQFFFFLRNEGREFIFSLWGALPADRHPQPRAQFSKSPPGPRQIQGPELRPAASTMVLWNASWPGLWLWKLCPGPGVSAVQGMCGGVSAGRWLAKKWSMSYRSFQIWMNVCMYVVEIKCLKRWVKRGLKKEQCLFFQT